MFPRVRMSSKCPAKTNAASSDTDSSSDAGFKLTASKFYASKAYIPPLERKSLKRKISPACNDVTNTTSDSASSSSSNTKKKRKTASKSTKNKSLLKENNKSFAIKKLAKPEKPKSVDPSLFLSKKVEGTQNVERKFFKNRSPGTLRHKLEVNLTREKIVPMDMKGLKASKCLPSISKAHNITLPKVERNTHVRGAGNMVRVTDKKSQSLISRFSPPDSAFDDETSRSHSSESSAKSSSSSSVESSCVVSSSLPSSLKSSTSSSAQDKNSVSHYTRLSVRSSPTSLVARDSYSMPYFSTSSTKSTSASLVQDCDVVSNSSKSSPTLLVQNSNVGVGASAVEQTETDALVVSEPVELTDTNAVVSESSKSSANSSPTPSVQSSSVGDSASVTEQTETNASDDDNSDDFTWTPASKGTKMKGDMFTVLKPVRPPVHKAFKRSLPKVPKKLKPAVRDEDNQMMLDAGQKEIGAKVCPDCGMVYHIGNVSDENLHNNFHETYLNSLKFHGWKKEKVVGDFIDGRVIMVTKEDPNFMMKKVNEVLSVINRELGTENVMPIRPDPAFFLFCSVNKKIVGCLVAESITYAFSTEVDSDTGVINIIKEEDGEFKRVKALCGVNRLWVSKDSRRQQIATRLMNCLRCNYLYGYPIPLKQLAFLDPSSDAIKFFAGYSKNKQHILVYK